MAGGAGWWVGGEGLGSCDIRLKRECLLIGCAVSSVVITEVDGDLVNAAQIAG